MSDLNVSQDPQNDQCGSRDEAAAPATAALATELRHYPRRHFSGDMEVVDRQFDFIRCILPYDYAYTSNSQQWSEAERICHALEGAMAALGVCLVSPGATASTTPAGGTEQVAAPVVQQPREAQKLASPQDRIDVEGLKAARERSGYEVAADSMRSTLNRWARAQGRGGYPTAMERYAMATVLTERAELIAQRAALVALAKSIKDDLEYLMEWGKIKPHEIVAEIDALLSTIQAEGGE